MSTIDEIIKLILGTITLSDIILYMSTGFIFIWTFNFIATNQNSSDYTHFFLKSVISGFIIINLAKALPFTTGNYYMDILGIFVGTIISSYCCARFYSGENISSVLKFFKIRRTTNAYIWNDIEDKSQSLWVMVGFKSLNIKYYGLLVCIEDFQRYPQIVLTRYTKGKFNEDLIKKFEIDFSNNPEQRVLLDTSKADIIELIYDEKSHKIQEI